MLGNNLRLLKYTQNDSTLGDVSLFQTFFICIKTNYAVNSAAISIMRLAKSVYRIMSGRKHLLETCT